MQSRDFCFWLQGFFELGDDTGIITTEQTAVIKCHLDLVFAYEIAPGLRERPAPSVPEPKAPPRPAPGPDRETTPDPEPCVLPPPTPRC
jgi:hypothetical protein